MNDRTEKLNQLEQPWDLIIIGGGITGAAIYNLASSLGVKTLLVEARDFSWGTSSRSSKLIHGGLRYLKQGKIGLTRDSISERERLLSEFQNYAHPMDFYHPVYSDRYPSKNYFRLGLFIYDVLSGKKYHKNYSKQVSKHLFPEFGTDKFQGGLSFRDAVSDDSQLVLGLLKGDTSSQSLAINYVKVVDLLKKNGRVCGVSLEDQGNTEDSSCSTSAKTIDVSSKLVINATGVWSDSMRKILGKDRKLRPLKGSHIIIPSWRLNLATPFTIFHPKDRRGVYAVPWKNVTLVGSTDIDFNSDFKEPKISHEETNYLLDALNYQYPNLHFDENDILTTFSGVRPVIYSGKKSSYDESRDELLIEESGMITATGGKLTTHRLTAINALKMAGKYIPKLQNVSRSLMTHMPPRRFNENRSFELAPYENNDHLLKSHISTKFPSLLDRLTTHNSGYAFKAPFIKTTNLSWQQFIDYADDESIQHLDDLMLRRSRLGLVLKEGGAELMPAFKDVLQTVQGWDDAKWEFESTRYQNIWQNHYSARPQ